jgi:hypothetical protein
VSASITTLIASNIADAAPRLRPPRAAVRSGPASDVKGVSWSLNSVRLGL